MVGWGVTRVGDGRWGWGVWNGRWGWGCGMVDWGVRRVGDGSWAWLGYVPAWLLANHTITYI